MKIPRCIKAVAKTAGTHSRQALGYVRAEADVYGAFRYVASDGRQMVCVSSGSMEENPHTALLVNAKQLARAAPRASFKGSLTFDGKKAYAENESGVTAIDTADLIYPNYRAAFSNQLDEAEYRPIRLDAKRLKSLCDVFIAAKKSPYFTLYVSDKEKAVCMAAVSDDGEQIQAMLMPVACDMREIPDVRDAMNLDKATEEATA